MLGQLKNFIFQPTLRLNLIVISGVLLLLSVSMAVMFYFTHETVHQESKLDAEQTLEGAAQHVDIILRSVEQSAGNIYSELSGHLDQPERMYTYSRQLVECNPYIVGAAICMKPGYYPGRDLFMAYVHRKGGGMKANGKSELVTSDTYGTKDYTEHTWYSGPMTTSKTCWTNPEPEEEDEGVTISFCIPILDQGGERAGVLVADLSVDQLSQIVHNDEPLNNRYCVLLGSDGSYIVHPDRRKRMSQTVYTLTKADNSSTLHKATEAMMEGKTGYMPFQDRGKNWYVFYKPFEKTEVHNRAMEKLNWSIGVVYSKDAVFGSFNRLLAYVLVISALGLLLLFLLGRLVSLRIMKPLRQLTHATRRIAAGHYDDPMPDMKRDDEIGLLYTHFQLMRQSLANHVKELDQLADTLKNRREVMNEVYAKEQSIDRVKTNFLHYVTNQMIAPAEDIEHYVTALCENYQNLAQNEIEHVVDSIDKKSETIYELINQMLNTANSEAGQATGGQRSRNEEQEAHE